MHCAAFFAFVMRYVFSFDKKQLITLAALLAAIVLCVFVAGVLVGHLSATPAGVLKSSPPYAPVAPAAPAQ